MPEIKIINNDCLIALREYPDNYFDAVVTGPPYGLGKEPNPNDVMKDWIEKGYHEIKGGKGFMGKEWDAFVPQPILWKEVFRVLKPGGHLLSFCGTRTYDWMVMSLRFGGFEIRDAIFCWVHSQGFPKSLDISKAMDKHFGVQREIIGQRQDILKKQSADIKRGKRKIADSLNAGAPERNNGFKTISADISAPATDQAKKFDGYGTALKPACEPICVARKPLSEKTIVENILRWGTGAINIDGCRIDLNGDYKSVSNGRPSLTGLDDNYDSEKANQPDTKGRFPANVIFDEETGKILDNQSGILKSGNLNSSHKPKIKEKGIYGKYGTDRIGQGYPANEGGASRFFYCAKASRSERNKGLENMDFKKSIGHNRFDKCKICGKYILQNPDRPSACQCENPEREDNVISGNFHPTVKNVKLMKFLVKLVLPPNGTCLDPFNGSGTTGIACNLEGFNYVGIEQDKEYCDISRHRIEAWIPEEDEVNDKKESIIKSEKKSQTKTRNNQPYFKQHMEETDRIYGWISSVINSCKEPAHIELCDVLITLYEKKGAAKDLVKGLRESLKIKVVLIQEDNKNRQQASMEDRIWDLFSSGKYNVKQIAEIVKMDLRKCDAIITRKLNK